MTATRGPKIVLAGSVSFSERTLEGLLRNGANVVGVLGLAESASTNVSDYAPLRRAATAARIPYADFTKINAPPVAEQLQQWQPDVLFVVGLSQLVSDRVIAIASMGAIGFHPTKLPEGRGRAPVAWLAHDGHDGAATFFVLENDADAGAIFVQEPFHVSGGMYSDEVVQAVRAAIDRALDRWIPRLIEGEWEPKPQDHSAATFWEKRAAEDGWIDWSSSAAAILRLVRTASRPYPGAYTYYRNRKLLIWRADPDAAPFRGVVGRILHVNAERVLVQSGSGLVAIREYEFATGEQSRLVVGVKLGYSVEDELHALRERIEMLEDRLQRSE